MADVSERDRKMAGYALEGHPAAHRRGVELAIAQAREEGRREARPITWEKIETAPKHKFILVWEPELKRRALVKWQSAGWYGVDDLGLTVDVDHEPPTHWQPLPEPPQ